jgi:hypothetical protein
MSKWRILAAFFDDEPLINWGAWGSGAGVFVAGRHLTLYPRGTSLTLYPRSLSLTLRDRD